MEKQKSNKVTILLILIMLFGVALIAYPSISNYWNSFTQSRAIMDYQEQINAIDPSEYARMIEEAHRYNETIAESGINWHLTESEKAEYNQLLAINQTGVMGYISIPKIHVNLPIYHGTTEEVLQTSIGHLEGTSLPVSGVGHSVLSGHRGLPSAKLFSDLDRLKVGDRWTVNILNETYTYEVDQIRIVLPEDLSNLQIEEGMDYQTLLTCTPYGVNTHRLLVRGHRVANEDGNALVLADAIQIEPIYIAPFIALPIILVLLILFLESTRRKQKEKKLMTWIKAQTMDEVKEGRE